MSRRPVRSLSARNPDRRVTGQRRIARRLYSPRGAAVLYVITVGVVFVLTDRFGTCERDRRRSPEARPSSPVRGQPAGYRFA
jgi:hypothetical protein